MDKKLKSEMNWWVDVTLILSAPVISLLVALLDCPKEMLSMIALMLPIPLAVALGIRLARRIKAHPVLHFMTGLSLVLFLYCLLCGVSVFGCALGGGTRHYF